jgi:hypothetical protein
MVTQLRIYTINRGRMEDFVRAWRDGIYPLRMRHGFRLGGAWVVEESNQFVWVLSYAGPEAWDDKERAYSQSPERAGLNPDPSHYVARAEQYFLTPVLPQV